MNKQSSLNNMRIIMIAVYIVFVMALVTWAVMGHNAAKHALTLLNSQRTNLAQLNTQIKATSDSIGHLKAEQEEFKTLLFSDRDVPAFIDGLSLSANKTAVHIIDMKTQRFSQIVVPKDISSTSQLETKHLNEDMADQNKKPGKLNVTEMITLAAMPIHIKIQGTFPAIVHFLDSVESARQLLTVSNVEITRDRDYPQLNCNFILNIYSLEQLKDIKA